MKISMRQEDIPEHLRKFFKPQSGLKPKDLIGMPWRLAFALQADGWWLRSEIIWAKPNPMPESVTDRPTKAHESIFLLTKAARYFYDADATREPAIAPPVTEQRSGMRSSDLETFGLTRGTSNPSVSNPAGRNARDVWTIATEPFPDAHFATFPTELPRRCIAAGTSERGVCPTCGAPWARVVEHTPDATHGPRTPKPSRDDTGRDAGQIWNAHRTYAGTLASTTIGWQPTCTHAADPIPATVLDPFAGSGTTIMVALRLGRSGIGIELNPTYAEMARARIVDDQGVVHPAEATNGRHEVAQGRFEW